MTFPDPSAPLPRKQLEEFCRQNYTVVQDRVHRLLARDIRRGRPWLSAMLSTGDIVHEVFLGVVRDFDGFRGRNEQQFLAYLARLTRNRIIDSVRHHEASVRDARRSAQRDAPEVASRQAGPGDCLAQQEEVERVYAILAGFPQRDQALLRGRVEDGESFSSLARVLGYASADSARKAYCAVQARLLAKLQLQQGGR